jgi:hypothetical protein
MAFCVEKLALNNGKITKRVVGRNHATMQTMQI